MQRWRHLRSILLLPATVTVLIPCLILLSTRSIMLGWGLPPPWQLAPLSAGLLCLAAGLRLLVQTIALFATQGQGTLAPWDPPSRLVVRGIYRHVRNPMISGVIMILFGESLLLGSRALVTWCALVTIMNMLYGSLGLPVETTRCSSCRLWVNMAPCVSGRAVVKEKAGRDALRWCSSSALPV